MERGQYGFLQDLLKQVAYDTLSKRERKAKHLAVAAHLQRSGFEEEEIAEVIASHFVDAYQAAPEAEDAQEVKTKARGALVQAGRRAASLAATSEAQRYFERALELTEDPMAQADLRELAGSMCWLGGRLSEADEQLDRAIELYLTIGDQQAAARVTARRAETDMARGDLTAAVERMERAFAVLSRDEPNEALAALSAQMGRALYFVGRPDESLERIDLALEIAEDLRLMEVM